MIASLDDLRDRCAELAALEGRLAACLGEVSEARVIARAELDERAREDMRSRPLGANQRSWSSTPPTRIPLESVRDAVVKLKRFVVSEFAAELGCTRHQALVQLKRVEQLVRPAGRSGNAQVYEYIEPVDPGEAFKAQQRLAPAVATGDLAPSRRGEVAQSLVSMIRTKEMREVARMAIADGWELLHGSGKHPMRLRRPEHRDVVLPSTPMNAGNAARAVRKQLGL